MFAIAATLGWILIDLAMFLLTSPMLPPWEWYGFLGAGLLLGAIALIGEIRDRRVSAREIAELKAGQTMHSQEHETLASGMVMLAGMVNANPNQSPVKIAEAAIAKIGALETRIANMQWRMLTAEQKRLFREAISTDARPELWRMYCVPADAEAEGYAKQLLLMFHEARVYMSEHVYEEFDTQLSRFDEYGMVLLAGDTNSPNVQLLKHALDVAEIAYHLEGFASSNNPQFVAIRIGPKPK